MDYLPRLLPLLLGLAVLAPLASFCWTFAFGRFMSKKESAAHLATGAIVVSGVLSFLSLFLWLTQHFPASESHGDAHSEHASLLVNTAWAQDAEKPAEAKSAEAKSTTIDGPKVDEPKPDAAKSEPPKPEAPKAAAEEKPAEAKSEAAKTEPAKPEEKSDAAAGAHAHDGEHAEHAEHHGEQKVTSYTGVIWTLGSFGKLQLAISYYIDSLTLVMFCMVTLIASCIHCYAMGYMHDELHDITDHEVTLENGKHLHRPGRFHRFFQYLSLFCFSMLGLVYAGNIAMVFVFWELVGICSYFLIGFYVERKSASTAANKAFIVNRVGDFGMIIGLMALWSALGTFNFGDVPDADGNVQPGLFSLVRSEKNEFALAVPDGMYVSSATSADGDDGDKARDILTEVRSAGGSVSDARARIEKEVPGLSDAGYWLLIIAGVGIFCGCVGKSAQFPLHVWLPDAMEGPTPVSALVHSATMVAAGVYLVGRFFPVFAPEVLVVIATTGCITLFLAASIAITANDIKRVLAYSTVSQLGYMMLALGVGGWVAGLYHLVTHAFFKSLLFMCSGSVIHAVHTNDMRSMGGLLKKMPVTGITMLIGCLAIAGVGIPFFLGFSGYYSKDAILEQAFSLWGQNGSSWAGIYFLMAAGGAAITSFYMFRMWYMTFLGKPRDQERFDHAHESPPIMYGPLVLLSVFAVAVAWNPAYIGYALIPIGTLIYVGRQRGWFKSSHGHGHAAHGHDAHGHDAHGHDTHGHDSHGHDSHGHDTHAAHHDDHGHADHGHGAHGSAGGFPFGLGQVAALIVISLVGGFLIETQLPVSGLTLENMLKQSQPAGLQHADVIAAGKIVEWVWPNEHFSHAASIKIPVTLLATGTWIVGIALATMLYATGYLNPADVRRQFSAIYTFLVNKWWFDELYDRIFVRPTKAIGRMVAGWDKNGIDWFIDSIALVTRRFSELWDRLIDKTLIDGRANWLASVTYRIGSSLRAVQTGKLRQYVMFIVLGAIAVFVLISFFWSTSLAR